MINLKTGLKFPRGAWPTPRHKLLAATPHRVVKAVPAMFAVVPKQLSMWGNSQYGDCVSAEEAYAKACWSIMCGLPETFIQESDVIAWAGQNGFLNGADLTTVMDAMAKSGMPCDSVIEDDGPYTAVDYSNEPILQSAISQGPVKIGIDADALPSGAGNQQGWYTIATGNYGNEDHCVGLSGYGVAAYLFGQLGVPVPSGLDPTTPGYLLFTWSTIGFVTHGWLMGTCAEAWLRNPTTIGQSPSPAPPVPPTPVPPTPPVPNGQATFNLSVTMPNGTIDTYSGTVAQVTKEGVGSFNWEQLAIAILTAILEVLSAGKK